MTVVSRLGVVALVAVFGGCEGMIGAAGSPDASPGAPDATTTTPDATTTTPDATTTTPDATTTTPDATTQTPDASTGGDPCVQSNVSIACTLALINQQRAAQSPPLPAYTLSAQLDAAAATHNQTMISGNCFSHQCPGEPDFATRITNAGYTWSAAAENIAAGQQTAADVVDAWMSSPGHRANLLGNYRDIGIARTTCSSGCDYSVYWTADFASP